MTTTVYLIRHGQTAPNRDGLVQGRGLDAPLNATGRAQAAALAARFADVPLDAVWASPLVRARETAEAVAAPHGLPVHLDADLEEMGWGVYEGAPETDTVRAALDRMRAAWDAGDFDVAAEGGERLLDVQARALAAWQRLLAAHAGQTLAVVTHGRWLRILLASVLPGYTLRRMHELGHANTCVHHLVVSHDDPAAPAVAARALNCTRHLDAVTA